MTDQEIKRRRWKTTIFVLSLTFNVAVTGIILGAAWRLHNGERPPLMREVSFGIFDQALDREQRDMLRRKLGIEHGTKAMRDALRRDLVDVHKALMADPFDEAAFAAALERQNNGIAARVAKGRDAFVGLVAQMSASERAEFAQRLDQIFRKHRMDKPRH